MQIQIFTIPVLDSTEEQNKLNAFLRGNKIIDIEKQFVSIGVESFWSFCVRYIYNTNPRGFKNPEGLNKNKKIDYKEILDEQTFAKFSQLREIRKQISKEDAVPAYAIFTDAEMAEVAKLKEISEKNIQTIPGIGENKAQKYTERLIKMLNKNN